MISGVVTEGREAIVAIALRAADATERTIDAVIDTGFNGSLTLPPDLVAELDLPWLCRDRGILADGSVGVFDVHSATIDWDGQPKRVEVEVVEGAPLLGMSLLDGYDLRIQVTDGGRVEIKSLA